MHANKNTPICTLRFCDSKYVFIFFVENLLILYQIKKSSQNSVHNYTQRLYM